MMKLLIVLKNFIFTLLVQNISSTNISIFKSYLSYLLHPSVLWNTMFTQQITGQIPKLLPYKQHKNSKGQIILEEYTVHMMKVKQQILPKQLFDPTTMYVYGGMTDKGFKAMFPGPLILAKLNVPIRVKWINNIKGPHILPVDYDYPFNSSYAFKRQVPAVPHAHGVSDYSGSDGQPQAYWTVSGIRGQYYHSLGNPGPNQAIFQYPNEQNAGNFWYHDHTMGNSRLNVYAGLTGMYKIIDPKQTEQQKQQYLLDKYGSQVHQNMTKFLVVTDKSFKTNGQLFISQKTKNPEFTSWKPQLFGNTILVNGVIWPKMNLKQGKYRFVMLNACPSRYLNIWFQNNGKMISIELVRNDQDYYKEKVVVSQYFLSISNRIQFILDLSNIKGQVMLKNNAAAPHPQGDPQNLDPLFTGQILKIVIQNTSLTQHKSQKKSMPQKKLQKHSKLIYPRFKEGQKIFTTLIEVDNKDGQTQTMLIDGITTMNSYNCSNSTYEIGKVYDFYFINLTPDTHPIHFHLINMQKIKQFKFDVKKYQQKYFQLNGGAPSKYGYNTTHPKTLDPQKYKIGKQQYPKNYQKVFTDTIDAHVGYVTVMRIKFSKNNGQNFKSINLKGQKYVFHCHQLPHENNQMMKHYCLK